MGGVVPIRFDRPLAGRRLGLVVHLLVLTAMFRGRGNVVPVAQAGATMVAMTSNLLLNNVLTYRDPTAARLALRARLVLLRACLQRRRVVNVGIADYLFHRDALLGLGPAIAGVARRRGVELRR